LPATATRKEGADAGNCADREWVPKPAERPPPVEPEAWPAYASLPLTCHRVPDIARARRVSNINRDFRYGPIAAPVKASTELASSSTRPNTSTAAHRTDTRSPLAPSPRDPGGRDAASPAGPSLTPGIARFIGAKASVGTAIAL
jgi:hypothetical protein